MRGKHRAFYPREIREFWWGTSFLRHDDSNMRLCDPASMLAEQFGVDWPSLRTFVLPEGAYFIA